MDFGQKIRLARERLGLTRDELAKMMSIRYYTLAKYEAGLREPDFATLAQIARTLHVSVDYLLDFEEPSGKSDANPGLDEVFLKYMALSSEAKARVQNQISFEYAQQAARKKSARPRRR